MKKLLGIAQEYLDQMSLCDVGLLKFCLCAAGMLIGIAIPKKGKTGVAIVASGVFVITYVLLILPLLELIQKKNEI
ncbi:MAG: hypothetical protein RSB57_03340 [Hungatella sp.]